jgi:hypothetical protein
MHAAKSPRPHAAFGVHCNGMILGSLIAFFLRVGSLEAELILPRQPGGFPSH